MMEETKRIPLREELALEDTWRLEDLYASDALWEESLNTLQQDTEELAAWSGRLGENGESLCSYLKRTEEVNVKLSRLGTYCMRRGDEDTRNAVYQAMIGRFRSRVVALSAACSFETPELMAIPEEKLAQFYQDCPGLEVYRRYLTDQRRIQAHTLSAAEERLLASAGQLAEAPGGIFGAMNNADMKFPDAVDAGGERHPLSNGTFVSLENSPDRVLRKSAFENLYGVFREHRHTAAAVLDAQNQSLKFFAEARKFADAREAALFANNVPVAVYDNLIQAVHENLDKLHRYAALRKKLLGLDELHFYDLYVPLVPDADRKIPYAQAKETVLEALRPLGEDYCAVLQQGFAERWIDVYENQGKRSGAYSSGGVVHPYVLLNYTGTLDSQFTLAHEMGHALHTYYSEKQQRPIDADYVIFVAEVASTCNEALLMQHLLSRTADRRERAYLINHFLEQFRATLYRQTMFAEFERNIGRMTAAGETLTADALSEEYRKLNEIYFGSAMTIDEEIALEWARIPHFYYDYYVYQYATGFSAAIALSRRILSGGEDAVADYRAFLSGGCSRSPIELLKGAGVDMTGPEPVRSALKLFGELLDEMEALMTDGTEACR